MIGLVGMYVRLAWSRYKYLFLIVGAIFTFWLTCFHWTSYTEVGIRRNIITGEMSLDDRPGPELTWPWVCVSVIDTRPRRLCIECGCRNMTCGLVEFNPAGWREFVRTEGFGYYWLTNRLSYNPAASREYRGMDYILMGYAFDTVPRKFINIIQR